MSKEDHSDSSAAVTADQSNDADVSKPNSENDYTELFKSYEAAMEKPEKDDTTEEDLGWIDKLIKDIENEHKKAK